jgi:hypothetical protein
MCSVQQDDQQPIGAMFHASSFWSHMLLQVYKAKNNIEEKFRLQSTSNCYFLRKKQQIIIYSTIKILKFPVEK